MVTHSTNKKIYAWVASVIALFMAFSLMAVPQAEAVAFASTSRDSNSKSVVRISKGRMASCSGTLINSSWVISARHCADGGINKGAIVSAPGKRNVAKVRKVVKYPGGADAVLYQLDKKVSGVPVAKMYSGSRLSRHTKTRTYGYGHIFYPFITPSTPTSARGYISNPTASTKTQVLSRYYRSVRKEDQIPNFMNKLYGFSKVIPGDSGGAVFVGDELYGITSGGHITFSSIFGGTDTFTVPVGEIQGWIQKTIR